MLSFIQSMFLYSTPLLYASLGVLLLEITGVVNMAAEGMLIIGAFAAVIAADASGSLLIGALAAMGAAGLFGLLFAILAIDFQLNQTVLGIAFNLVGAGLTTTLNRAWKVDAISVAEKYKAGLFGFSAPIWIGFVLIVVMWIFMYKTNEGIRFRSVGENPVVVESMGISIRRLRYEASIVSAMLVGFGGAFLSTGLLSGFTENMSSGRGFFALAAVTFGNYTPFGMFIGVLIFGAGETLSFRLQASGSAFPYELALMIPYILIILFLCLFARNVRDTASLGIPYAKST